MDIRSYFSSKGGTAKPAGTGAAASNKDVLAADNKGRSKSPAKAAAKPSAAKPAAVKAAVGKAASKEGVKEQAASKSKYFPPEDGSDLDDDDYEDEDMDIKPTGGKRKAASASKAAPPAQKRRTNHSTAVLDDDVDSDVVCIDADNDDDMADVKPSGSKLGAAVPQSTAKPAVKAAVPSATAAAPGAASARKLPASLQVKAEPIKASLPGPAHASKPSPSKPAAARGAAAIKESPVTKRKGKSAGPMDALDAAAQLAVKLVDKAIPLLPPDEEVKYTVLAEGQDGAANQDADPPNYGTKDAPRGHPDCLTGKTFVLSGVMDSLKRPQAEDFIKRHGGRITGSVSGKTTFLVVGDSCGRSKIRTAKEKGTKLIDEDGLFSLVKASEPALPNEAAIASAPEPVPVATQRGVSSAMSVNATAATQGAGSSRPTSIGGTAAQATSQAVMPVQPRVYGENMQLWVDKHKPKTEADLVGNESLSKALKQWLLSWDDVHRRGMPAPVFKQAKLDGKKKAVLLSGAPGIGKTSAAHIIAKACGYEVVEMNASDTRNKSDAKVSAGIGGKLSNMIKEMATNTSFGGANGTARKQLLIMDEVDGMSAGDRGGVADLIQTMKISRIPIICICNDRYAQKLKSLRNHVMELDYHKPTTVQISKHMLRIAKLEGLEMNQATMDALVSTANGDLRLVLGQLQMVRLRSRSLQYDQVKGRMANSKDAEQSPFECARKLMDASAVNLSVGERSELVFSDMDLVPLLIAENYVNHKPVYAGTDMALRLRGLAKAADAISLGDILNSAIRRTNTWSLAPAAVAVGSVLTAAYARGSREVFGLYPGEMNFPRFTAWMGVNSTTGKQKRLLGELTTTMSSSGTILAARQAVRLEYTSALRYVLSRPLHTKAEAGIDEVQQIMSQYCIDREQFDFIMDVTKFKSKEDWAEDPLKGLQAAFKSKFTRTVNSQAGPARCSLQAQDQISKKKGKGAKKQAALDDEEDDVEMGEGGEDMQVGGEDAAAKESDDEESEDLGDALAMQRKLGKRGVVLTVKGEVGKKRGGSSKSAGGTSAKGKTASSKGASSKGSGKSSAKGKK